VDWLGVVVGTRDKSSTTCGPEKTPQYSVLRGAHKKIGEVKRRLVKPRQAKLGEPELKAQQTPLSVHESSRRAQPTYPEKGTGSMRK
jgi:hypothetical protein